MTAISAEDAYKSDLLNVGEDAYTIARGISINDLQHWSKLSHDERIRISEVADAVGRTMQKRVEAAEAAGSKQTSRFIVQLFLELGITLLPGQTVSTVELANAIRDKFQGDCQKQSPSCCHGADCEHEPKHVPDDHPSFDFNSAPALAGNGNDNGSSSGG